MRNSLRSLLLLLTTTALAGCGKFDRIDDGGFTKVTFTNEGRSLTSAAINGGLVIYASSLGYTTNLKVTNETQVAAIDLPNGVYTFYAFGFGNASGPSDNAGNVHCAFTGAVPLNGTAQNVGLQFTSANCDSAGFFAPSAHIATSTGGKYFNETRVVGCASTVNVSTKVATDDCNGATWAGPASFQMVLPIFRGAASDSTYQKIGEAYRSACAVSSAGTAMPYYVNSGFFVPVGVASASQRFPVEVEIFNGNACGTKLATFNFHRGLAFTPKDGVAHPAIATNNSYTAIFVRAP